MAVATFFPGGKRLQSAFIAIAIFLWGLKAFVIPGLLILVASSTLVVLEFAAFLVLCLGVIARSQLDRQGKAFVRTCRSGMAGRGQNKSEPGESE